MVRFSFIAIAALAASVVYATPALNTRASPDNTVHITSASDHCIILPRDRNTNIGDSERPGGMKSYCTKKYDASQGKIPKAFWKNGGPNFKKTSKYVQLTGCINPGSSPRLNPNDGGGQYDSNGGDGGRGNPAGSVCLGYASYVEIVEPDANRACIRCCKNPSDCDLSKDTQGCPAVIKGNYNGCN